MKLYNSLTRSSENFTSFKNNEVKMYVCGITPYDTTHLGHAFTYLTFDILHRFLTYKGYTVKYTQNVTDVDDDLLKKARETERDWQDLGGFWTKKFLNDLNDLNILMPTYYVKATDSIDSILEIVKKLIKEGFAYEKEGNVYFRVTKDPNYGKLSRFSREEMIRLSKDRGADPDDPRKEDPLDFIMWQKSKTDEPSWESPWGKGRPGWHIECSAMIKEYLGDQIDIHGGGIDLIYPHHESEIAQSENFTGKRPFSKFFMHTGAVEYQGEKMSKSLGNLVMVSDLLKKYSANTIKYMLLSHHYREPWEFHEKELDLAQEKMKHIQRAVDHKLAKIYGEVDGSLAFTQALDDDLNTPEALKILGKFAKETNKSATFENQKTLMEMCALLGFTI